MAEEKKNNINDFDKFDRAVFIAQYLNPICNEIYQYHLQENIAFATYPKRAIPDSIPNMFIKNAFDLSFYMPSYGIKNPSKEVIDLG